ncbi:MAG TPA: hypothetical protein VLG72_00365 [Nitrospirota bacterium]|nr:hypothetical protein [Nitrospirota bacterium]
MSDFNKLIPELSDWNNGKGIDVVSWIGCVGDFQKAIGYSVMFWPHFEECARQQLMIKNLMKIG